MVLLLGIALGVWLAVLTRELGPLIATRLSKSFTREPDRRSTTAVQYRTTEQKSRTIVQIIFTKRPPAAILDFRGAYDRRKSVLDTGKSENKQDS